MAIAGTTTISATIAPNNEKSSTATHSEQWGKGGYRSVLDITERDALLNTKRWSSGMLVNVLSEDIIYKLVPIEGADINSTNVYDYEFKELSLATDLTSILDRLAALEAKLYTSPVDEEPIDRDDSDSQSGSTQTPGEVNVESSSSSGTPTPGQTTVGGITFE